MPRRKGRRAKVDSGKAAFSLPRTSTNCRLNGRWSVDEEYSTVYPAFFASLASRIDGHRKELRWASQTTAPLFCVFDFIKPNENALSDIVAELLDPQGSHGQGDVFLRAFLIEVGL